MEGRWQLLRAGNSRHPVSPASTLVWEALGDPLCVKCRSRDALLGDPSALAGGADPTQHHGPFTCTEFSRNSCVMGLKVPKAHAQLCEGHGYWITNVDHREDQFSPGTSRSRAGKSPLAHSSILAWRILWTEEPGRLQSTGSRESQTQLNN